MSNLIDKTVDFLKILSHPIRLKIIEILEDGEKNVNDIQEALSISQSTTSQHLKKLTNANLLEYRQDGLHNIYRIKNPNIHNLILVIEKFISDQETERIRSVSSSSVKDTLS
ncbi:MAG: ArsR family transcriptional regulator [Promethearchaeota archaeon]|nr:MAG: ArsR family transcriptional regulator [Candidatus Lokiarchaeota archaeon]